MNEETKTFEVLKKEWKALQQMTHPQQRGKALEPWLKDLFRAGGLHAVGSFTRSDPDAELDGAVSHNSITYLLEAKWKNKPLDADPGIKLRDRVEDGTPNTKGLLISVSGFNNNAVTQAGRKKPLRVFLVDESHLTALMNEDISVAAWLEALERLAALHARACFPIGEIIAEARAAAEAGGETNDTGGLLLLTHLPLRHHFKLIGRETDLDTLEKRIATTQLVLLVNGLGGVGKTEVCKRFFLDHYRDYEAAAWVDYVGGLEVSLVHAVDWESPAVQRGLDARPEEETPDQRFKKIARFLRDSGTTTLLVVDNIGDADDPGLDLLRRLPDNVKVLVTSRLEIPEFEAHRLDVLDEAECLELFYGFYGGERDDPAVQAVTARCGRHTLTVELLARTARNAGHTPGELLDTLETKGFHLDEGIRTFWHEQKGYKPLFGHLETIFQLSGVTESEQFILANLSVLPPVYMPTADIRDWLGLETGTDITGLVDKGWLRRDELKIYMHPVVREVIRFKTQPDAAMCEKLIVSLAWKLKLEPGDNPLSRERYVIFAASMTAGLDDNDKNLASLANNLGLIYRHLGRLDEALAAQLKALGIREQVLDENHPHLATSYNNLSLIYQSLGRLDEALEAQLKAQKVWEQVLDKNHPHLATSYNNLSLIYKSLGRLDDALAAQLKDVNISEQVLDKNHPHLAASYNNLATIYYTLNDYSAAETYAQKAVAIMQTLFPGGHHHLDKMKRNLEGIRKSSD